MVADCYVAVAAVVHITYFVTAKVGNYFYVTCNWNRVSKMLGNKLLTA